MLDRRLLRIDSSIHTKIEQWLEEDIGTGDLTTSSIISDDHHSKAIVHVKEPGIVAGIPVATAVFQHVDSQLLISEKMVDGDELKQGAVLFEIIGRTGGILRAERLALNLLQRLSGIATRTRNYVDQLTGIDVRLVDTRKTTPGHRALEKYAVRIGGGYNHRFGLYDAVMIKDNHIKAAGGIHSAVKAARTQIPHTVKIEVEAENPTEWQDALEAGADIIMLDNTDLAEMKTAVQVIKQQSPHTIIEASGGLTEQTIRAVAECGVDVISVGALTSSVQSLDISLDLYEKKEASL